MLSRHYHFMLILGLIVIGMVFYFIDLQPLLKQQRHFFARKQDAVSKKMLARETAHRLADVKKTSKVISESSNQSLTVSLLGMLAREASKAGVIVQSAGFVEEKADPHKLHLHLVVLGNFTGIMHFFSNIMQIDFCINCLSFKYEANGSAIHRIATDFIFVKTRINKEKNGKLISRGQSHDPFCYPGATRYPIETEKNISIRQMKMVGYVGEDHNAMGIIKLPSQQIITVKMGSCIGKEHAKVISIETDGIEFLLQGRRKIRLSLQKLSENRIDGHD